MGARRSPGIRFRNSLTLAASFLLLASASGAGAVSLSSLSLKPATVVSGVSSVATVALDGPAGAGGALVWFFSDNHDIAPVPYNITVPEGAASAFIVVPTAAVASPTPVTITAYFDPGAVTRTAVLTVVPREPVRGVQGDLWADVILGKPAFTEFTPNEVVPYKVFNPGGVFVDRTAAPGRAYVWDSGNSRILGIDLATCYGNPSPCPPQIVIGQPSGSDHSSCNGDSNFQHYPTRAPATADSLCGLSEATLSVLENKSFITMAGDEEGNLYVPDPYNNRLLKYISPFTTDTTADEVWGQSDFSGNQCNRGALGPSSATASTLCFNADAFSGGGAALDPFGNLWVADQGNNRVLRFPKNPGTGVIAKTADIVLGQPDFASNSEGSDLTKMHHPSSVRFRPSGELFVTDSDNSRVLVFTPNPDFVSGMPGALFGSQFVRPFGLEVDPAGQGLWVNDTFNSMIELWNWSGTAVLKVLGSDIYRPDGSCRAPLCYSGGGIGIDAAGNLLPSVYTNGQDVLRFAAPIPTPQPGFVYQPDKLFFSPPLGFNLRGLKGIRSAAGIAISGNQLIVADAGRLLFWNGLGSLTDGKAADGQVGNPDFDYQANCCGYVKLDGAGRLWVQKYLGAGIDIHTVPLVNNGPQPTNILQPGPVAVLGGGTTQIGDFGGVLPTANSASVWVSDIPNNRVLRIRNPLTSPLVDVVLGQTDINGTLCNRGLVPPPNQGIGGVPTADMICHPGALSFDRQGNLFVSDHGPEAEGNWRLLRFAAGLFPANNAHVLFAVPATKIFPWEGGQPAITFEPAFDSLNRMVVGYNSIRDGSFVGVYNDPAGPDTDPDTYLNDFSSYPVAAAFDADDNLYVGEADRSRVLIYHKLPQLPQYSLTITRSGSGSGTVTSSPAGIQCGTACSKDFPPNTVVTLAAAAAGNSTFAGWSGDTDCSDGVVTLNTNKTCTARFELMPDLTVFALTAPAGAPAGTTISVTDTTKNIGTGPAGASTTRFYLSTNTTWDAGDTEIGNRGIPLLAAGASNSDSAVVTIPAGKATGNYFIIAKADADGALTESSEANNTRFTSIRISPPDLIVSAISVPAISGAGLPIVVTNTTKNQANTGQAPNSTTRFYLSANATWDAGDTPFAVSQPVGPLAPGASEPHSTTLTIPATFTGVGTWYVIAKADADGQIPETLETNNTLSDTIVIGPDLIVSALTVPATGGAGLPIIVTSQTKNQGGGSAAASTTKFYLSTNNTYGTGDVFLGDQAIGPLGPGAIGPVPPGSITLTIPTNTAAGSYYILAVADGPFAVPETNEANNTTAALIRLSPDLAVSALSAPASAKRGTAITVTDTTKNQGQGTAAATTTSFYLSTNNTFGGDTLLASRPVPTLTSGAASPGSTSVVIPAGTTPGNYFLLARADDGGAVSEGNENNNVLSRAVTITP